MDQGIAFFLVAVAIVVAIYLPIKWLFRAGLSLDDMYCTRCGATVASRTRKRGSLLIELILWLCMLFPGLIYTIWRLSTKHRICGNCGSPDVIPPDSPNAIRAR